MLTSTWRCGQSIFPEKERERGAGWGWMGGGREVGFTTTAKAANLNDLVMWPHPISSAVLHRHKRSDMRHLRNLALRKGTLQLSVRFIIQQVGFIANFACCIRVFPPKWDWQFFSQNTFFVALWVLCYNAVHAVQNLGNKGLHDLKLLHHSKDGWLIEISVLLKWQLDTVNLQR